MAKEHTLFICHLIFYYSLCRSYMADLLDIYAQRVEHIAPTRWIYIADALELYIQHAGYNSL